MQLADPGCDIEQKPEPAHPIEELHFADFATLGGKPTDRIKHLAEKAEDPSVSLGRRAFKTRITFADITCGDYDGTTERDTGDDAQNLELCIA